VATLRAGAAGYSVVFGVVFTGLAIGMLAGPRILPTVPRRSVFTHAIGLAGIALLVMSVLRDFVLATAAAFCVGLFAGVSWIIGYTLIGFEVEDRLRGRVFAFVISSVRVVLLLAVAVGPGLAGLLGTHDVRLGDLVLTLTGPGPDAAGRRRSRPAGERLRHPGRWCRPAPAPACATCCACCGAARTCSPPPQRHRAVRRRRGGDRELTRRYTADLAQVLREEVQAARSRSPPSPATPGWAAGARPAVPVAPARAPGSRSRSRPSTTPAGRSVRTPPPCWPPPTVPSTSRR
jgi:dTMP kinase